MKALTICNPWPAFILYSNEELPGDYEQKRVENRNWDTRYRGQLLIHAGKSKEWLLGWSPGNIGLMPKMHFGFLVGVVELVDIVTCGNGVQGDPRRFARETLQKYPWLQFHTHAFGRFCWILENPRRFAKPIEYRGSQGLFDVPDKIISEVEYVKAA